MLSLRSTGEVVPRSLDPRQEPDAGSLPRYLVARKEDLVVNPMWLIGGGIGVTALDGAVSPDYRVFRPRAGLDPQFLHYLLRSQPYLDQYVLYTRAQTTFDRRVQQGDLDNVPVLLPPIDEQRTIADYLDRETARIDTLIEEQQRLIALLRERRTATIAQAVFAGVDGADTTESAAPWLPPTPTDWSITQLGFLADTLAGYAFPSDGFSFNAQDTRLLRGINIKPGRIDWSDIVYWNLEVSPVPSEYVLSEGDLVLGMDRPFVAEGVRVTAIGATDTPSLLLQRVLRIRPLNGGNKDYLRYVVSTGAFLAYLEPLFTGVSVPHISEWQVRKFKMPLPPTEEQRRIASHLDEQTAKIDTLIAETERFIELSRERCSALITAAVTGQIDVRSEVP